MKLYYIYNINMVYLFVITSSILLALKGIFAKLAMQYGVSVDSIIFYRSVISLPILWIIALCVLGKSLFLVPKKDIFLLCISGVFGYYLGSKFDFSAIQIIGANISRLILFTFPIFVILINAVMNKKIPSFSLFVILFIVQIGLILTIYQHDMLLLGDDYIAGIMFSICAALTFSIYVIMTQKYAKILHSLIIVTYALTASTIAIIVDVLSIDYHIDNLIMPWQAFGWIMCIVIFSTIIPFLCFAESIKKIGANQSAIISALSPFATVIFAYVLINETMTMQQILGGCIIVAAISYLPRLKKNT